MARVTEDQVRSLAQKSDADASIAITTANIMVDSNLASTSLSEDVLKMIELYLAAHFLCVSVDNGPLASKALGEAKESYHNVYEAGLKSTRFGQQALLFDTTGTLAALTAKAEKPTLNAEFRVV